MTTPPLHGGAATTPAAAPALDAERALDPTVPDRAKPAEALEDGIALCLSGGGYRAMLFHLGACWRLNELGVLGRLRRVSSVSGGSITAGVLALAWPRLRFDPATGAAPPELFREHVVRPVLALAGRTIDVGAVLRGVFLPGSVADRVERAYDDVLFKGATLRQLPDDAKGEGPRFVFNATSVQTGTLFRFSRPYMADYRVGVYADPDLPLAKVVAASSAFPPVLSPVVISLPASKYQPGSGAPEHASLVEKAVLTDGGVYDNLGLETAWKRYRTLIVSDGGQKMGPDPSPARNWPFHVARVLNVIDNQVRSLRKRMLVDAFRAGIRAGTYFGIGTDIADYGVPDTFAVPHARSLALARVPTRLARLPAGRQEELVNWGYAVCDAGLRRWVLSAEELRRAPEKRWPYPARGLRT